MSRKPAAKHAGSVRRYEGRITLPLSFKAAAAEGGVPRVEILAYTGPAMTFATADLPVALDLASARLGSASIPVLRDHDRGRCLGHTIAAANNGRELSLMALLSVPGPDRDEVVASAANGFPWQASVTFTRTNVQRYSAGQKVEVNGRVFEGPIYVARDSEILEVSIVSLGADADTSARLAAMRASFSQEGKTMTFSEWLKEKGFTETDPDRLAVLYESYKKELADKAGDASGDSPAGGDSAPGAAAAPAPAQASAPAPAGTPAPAQAPASASAAASAAADPVAAQNAALSANLQRVSAIHKLPGAADHADIVAKAIGENWSAERAENALLKAQQAASRPGVPAFHASRATTADSVAAAFCLQAGMAEDRVARSFSAQAVDGARPMRRAGLRHLLSAALAAAGRPLGGYADARDILSAAMSTSAVTSLLSNVADKILLGAFEGYQSIVWDVCRIRNVGDFKPHTAGRLFGPTRMRKIAPGGERNVSQLGESGYTNRVERRAEDIVLNYEMVENDDLGAFAQLPQEIGYAQHATLDDEYAEALLGASIFTAGNGNYVTGADTVFGDTGLDKLWTAMRTMKIGPSSKTKRLANVRPKFLLVPAAMENAAARLLGSDLTVGGSANVPDQNIWKGRLTLKTLPQLADSTFTGYSASAFYLLADPAVACAVELSILNGQRTPRIVLEDNKISQVYGMTMTAVFDYGLAVQEPQGAAKSKGSA